MHTESDTQAQTLITAYLARTTAIRGHAVLLLQKRGCRSQSHATNSAAEVLASDGVML